MSGLTLVQLTVASAMRARVLSLYGLLFRGGPAVGAVAMGAASDLVGLRWPVAVGAAVMLALLLGAMGRLPRFATAVEASR